jgi:hypothetical protein
MLTCEKCGKSFEQPDGQVVEVTSLRVLCPACAAARAAAKARQTAPSGVHASGEARTKEAPSASIPAKKVQARPDSTQARPASAHVRPDPATARPKPAPASAARTPTPGPRSAAPAPAQRKPEKKHRIDSDSLASHDLHKKGSREIWLSFGVAVLVFAVAGGVLWKVLGQKAAEKAESDRIQAKVDDFRNTFRAIDISTEEGARQLIVCGDENKPIWENRDDLGSEVINRIAKAKDFLERLEVQKELLQRLDAIEQVMARAAELPPSELAEQLRRLDELKAKASIVGADFEARIDKDRADGERVHMERLVATAEAAAATSPLDRAALTTLATVEDDVHRVFENVYRQWDKNKQDVPLSDKKKDYEDKYKRVIALSDDAVERFFSPEVVEGVPWRDLLSDPTAWKTSELKGFEHNIRDGALSLVGPDPSEDGQGAMSIGDKEIWRDFIVEMEFTIEQGHCELFFRLSPVWQKNVETRELTTDEGHLETGRTYNFVFSVIASTLVEEQQGEEPLRDRVSWTQVRKGAFGLSVPKNTQIKFTRMRAKVLR